DYYCMIWHNNGYWIF
nr:immunoglobulin light chain junction region [Macaca mulatta]